MDFTHGAPLYALLAGLVALQAIFGYIFYRFRKDFIGNYVIASSMILLTTLFSFMGKDMPKEPAGPMALPTLLGSLLVVISAILLIQAGRKKLEQDPSFGNIKAFLSVLGCLILYTLAIDFLGYFVSTLLFVVGMIYLLTYRNHIVIWSVACGWSLFSYLVFYKALYIQLPLGYIYTTFFE